ncbi:hypothetical protein GCM10012275_25320 [Longimycelium tulufanense]|uniref:Uncharacterized protein n=1 Tax=Longimycelium tulufanense TaxID=907463 RepID=A0A8J3FU96_9PSEU|nr:hypothetical protein [Longimycelium tulufanense]GGM53268.1 hypothetical protein GCM10012275_25320 [Longimycelium tulufanense]
MRALPRLAASPVGAVAVDELRAWRCDPRRQAALLPVLLVGLAAPLVPLLAVGALQGAEFLPYTAVAVVLMAYANTSDVHLEQPSHASTHPAAVHVRGRQLAWLLWVGPVSVVAALALPALAGRAETYPWVLSLVPALLGTAAGALVVPPALCRSPHRSVPGRATRLVLPLGVAMAAGPESGLVLAGDLAGCDILRWLAVPTGVTVGVLAAWWLGRVAAARVAPALPAGPPPR